MWHVGDGWGWWMAFGWVWMLALIGLVVWAIGSLANRRPDEPDRPAAQEPNALEILERRYARGEISHDKFEEMRQRLRRPTTDPAGR